MKNLLATILGLGLMGASLAAAQTMGSNFLSVQHPDWPPLPAPPDKSIEVFELEPGVYVMDDSQWKYPKVPAFTNAPPQFKDPVGDFRFNTNLLARRPQDLEFLKRSSRAMSPTNGLPRAAQLMIQRRQKAMFAEFDRVARWGREHPAEAAKLPVLDENTGKPLAAESLNHTNSLSR